MGCSSAKAKKPEQGDDGQRPVCSKIEDEKTDSHMRSGDPTPDTRQPMAPDPERQILSVNSEKLFNTPEQTILFFDWDDTLCPSSAIRTYSAKFDSSGRLLTNLDDNLKERLSTLQFQAVALVKLASQLGKVVIVTNSRRPWVEISCEAFLPKLPSCMTDVTVIYASEFLDKEVSEIGPALLTESKRNAMKRSVNEFYSRYPNQSWKNIVSFGDAFFEHAALRHVVEEHQESTNKKCRTKVVKFLEGPTVNGLAIQQSIVQSWLKKLAAFDGDVDIDLGADENRIGEWKSQFAADTE